MSYDLMVFDTKAAPQSREGFLAWYDKQTEWSEGHTYKDITVSADQLQRFMKIWFKYFRPWVWMTKRLKRWRRKGRKIV